MTTVKCGDTVKAGINNFKIIERKNFFKRKVIKIDAFEFDDYDPLVDSEIYSRSDYRDSYAPFHFDDYIPCEAEETLDPSYAEIFCRCVDEETAEKFCGFQF